MDRVHKYIKALQNQISISKLAYDAWWTLAGEDSGQYQSLRAEFPTHFNLSQHSYLCTLIVTLYMPLENKRETINIPQLIILMKKRNLFSTDEISHIDRSLENAKVIWKKLHILRCCQFAHLNFELSESGAFAKASIKPIELKQYMAQLGDIINFISTRYDNSSHAFNTDDRYSTRQFMDSLVNQDLSTRPPHLARSGEEGTA